MSARASRRVLSPVLAALVLFLCLAPSGCATLTGTVTGAFTGLVDAPNEVYRQHRSEFRRTPVYWSWNAAVVGPLGSFIGPLAGLGKGLALDVQWLRGDMTYDRVFETYDKTSIWRPYSIHW